MNTIERIIRTIRKKYFLRLDARDGGRKKSFKKGSVSVTINKSAIGGKEPDSWVTVNGNHIPVDEDRNPVGGQLKALGSGSGGSSGNSSSAGPERAKVFTPGERTQAELRSFVEDGFKSGTFSDKIDWTKQNKHRKDSKEYRAAEKRGEHPSWFTISDDEIEAIIKKHIHGGTVEEHINAQGHMSYRIPFKHDKEIAKSKSTDGTKIVPTDSGYIHLSKTGVHITPKYYVKKKGRK